jgi:hypothetical protein
MTYRNAWYASSKKMMRAIDLFLVRATLSCNPTPHFNKNLLFYEYFDGDTGRGLGASHQTGWTGLVAKLIQPITKSSKKK